MNDVILNRRVTILDKEALLDAKRSLTVMLGDFLRQHKVRGGGRRQISPPPLKNRNDLLVLMYHLTPRLVACIFHASRC